MIIHLASDWRINSDSSNWILQRRRVQGEEAKVPGTVEWRSEAFAGNLSTLVLACAQRSIRFEDTEHDVDSLEPILERLDRIEAICKDLAKIQEMENE